jgi:hypothetical protein
MNSRSAQTHSAGHGPWPRGAQPTCVALAWPTASAGRSARGPCARRWPSSASAGRRVAHGARWRKRGAAQRDGAGRWLDAGTRNGGEAAARRRGVGDGRRRRGDGGRGQRWSGWRLSGGGAMRSGNGQHERGCRSGGATRSVGGRCERGCRGGAARCGTRGALSRQCLKARTRRAAWQRLTGETHCQRFPN